MGRYDKDSGVAMSDGFTYPGGLTCVGLQTLFGMPYAVPSLLEACGNGNTDGCIMPRVAD